MLSEYHEEIVDKEFDTRLIRRVEHCEFSPVIALESDRLYAPLTIVPHRSIKADEGPIERCELPEVRLSVDQRRTNHGSRVAPECLDGLDEHIGSVGPCHFTVPV